MSGPATLSLVPDASEWMRFAGVEERLAGGTAACPARTGRADLPVCTSSSWFPAPPRGLVPAGRTLREPGRDLDPEAVRAADPATVIVDGWNESWGDGLGAWFEGILGHPVEIRPWIVKTFRDALEQALRMGRRYGAMERVMRLMGDREEELRAWRERTGIHRRAPGAVLEPVALLTSVDPPAEAAGWAHDVVDRAAARLVSGRSGEDATSTAWTSIRFEPRALALVSLPGRAANETLDCLRDAPGAREALGLAGRVVAYDGRGTLDGGGPGLHDAILDLMAVIHGFPDRDLVGRICEWPG